MRDRGDILFVQGTIIAVLLAIMTGRMIGPVGLLRPILEKRAASPPAPTQRAWTPARRD